MRVSYFPGCTLRTKAKELDKYTRDTASVLGIDMIEPENWQCCGGVFTTSRDEVATKLSSVRALKDAASRDEILVSVCSACHNVLKQTNHAMQTDEEFAARVNNYIAPESYSGEAKVMHYLELLRDEIGFDKIKEKVVNSLNGQRIAAYYGCLLLRPSCVMQMDNAENPSIMEDLIKAMGGEPVVYSQRNECCGGYITLENPDAAKARCNSIVKNALDCGAQMIITACPLCKYNLEKNGSEIPVVYFTELLAQVLGVK